MSKFLNFGKVNGFVETLSGLPTYFGASPQHSHYAVASAQGLDGEQPAVIFAVLRVRRGY
jgi:hypothetical protein